MEYLYLCGLVPMEFTIGVSAKLTANTAEIIYTPKCTCL